MANYTLTDEHITVLKGYLYELTRPDSIKPQNLRNFIPNIVDAVSWLEEHHSSSQTFKLEEVNNNNSVIIRNSVTNINNFISGQLPTRLVEATMINWGNIGLRIRVVRLNNSFTLRLKPFTQNSTKHLVYSYSE